MQIATNDNSNQCHCQLVHRENFELHFRSNRTTVTGILYYKDLLIAGERKKRLSLALEIRMKQKRRDSSQMKAFFLLPHVSNISSRERNQMSLKLK